MVTSYELLQREGSSIVFDASVDNFLENSGIPGMKWGHRKARIQKHLDRTQRIAGGTASVKDRFLGTALTKKGANTQLQRGANRQAKIAAGKGLMTKKTRTRMSELNFHKPGDAKAKLDRGQKQALGILAAVGAVHVITLIGAKRI